jgi:hypothetical protein
MIKTLKNKIATLLAVILLGATALTPAVQAETTWTTSMYANGTVYAIAVYLNVEGDTVSSDIVGFAIQSGVDIVIYCGPGLIIS